MEAKTFGGLSYFVRQNSGDQTPITSVVLCDERRANPKILTEEGIMQAFLNGLIQPFNPNTLHTMSENSDYDHRH